MKWISFSKYKVINVISKTEDFTDSFWFRVMLTRSSNQHNMTSNTLFISRRFLLFCTQLQIRLQYGHTCYNKKK